MYKEREYFKSAVPYTSLKYIIYTFEQSADVIWTSQYSYGL